MRRLLRLLPSSLIADAEEALIPPHGGGHALCLAVMYADSFVRRATEELIARGAHTVLLYGSRADGSATQQSDYDLAAFGGVEAVVRDARMVDGSYLDAFIYPETVLQSPTVEHLRLRGSKILVERDSAATKFLEGLEQLYRDGPAPLTPDEALARKVWAYKMLERASGPDAEGNYRRAWLLTALLEDYFSLRGSWFEGPKKSLRWLSEFDRETFDAFNLALAPGAELSKIAALIPLVVGSRAEVDR